MICELFLSQQLLNNFNEQVVYDALYHNVSTDDIIILDRKTPKDIMADIKAILDRLGISYSISSEQSPDTTLCVYEESIDMIQNGNSRN